MRRTALRAGAVHDEAHATASGLSGGGAERAALCVSGATREAAPPPPLGHPRLGRRTAHGAPATDLELQLAAGRGELRRRHPYLLPPRSRHEDKGSPGRRLLLPARRAVRIPTLRVGPAQELALRG